MEVMKALEDMVTGHEIDALKDVFSTSTGTGAERAGPVNTKNKSAVEMADEFLGKHWLLTEIFTFGASVMSGDSLLRSAGNALAIGGEVQGKSGLRGAFDKGMLAFDADQDVGGGLEGIAAAGATWVGADKLLKPRNDS